jgi:vitamin B12 transporter
MQSMTKRMVRLGVLIMEVCAMSRTVLIITTTLCAQLCSVDPSQAQQALGAPLDGETIIVTATRTPQAPQAVGSAVTVISGDQIVAAQTVSVIDVLRDVPGIGMNRNGGVGSIASVRIRGAEADQTVVLIDGVKLNDPSQPGGGFNFANLLAGDLNRIEVLRGPQSTLYGSQAIGGVINLISREARGPLEGSLGLEVGELATKQVRASVRGVTGGLRYGLTVGRFESEGISAAASGTETDSYSNDAIQARARYAINHQWAIDGQVWWAGSDVGIDGFPAPMFALADTQERSKTDELILQIGTTLTSQDDRWRTRLSLNQTTTDRDSVDPTLSVPLTFTARGRNERIELQSVFDVSDTVELLGGFEREVSTFRTAFPSSFDPNPVPSTAEATIDALFIQAQFQPTAWLTTTLAARHSNHDRFGDALNLRATVAAQFNDGRTILRAAIADGFKAPTLFQLYSDFGNQALTPEDAVSGELGVEHAFLTGRLTGSLTWFQRKTSNQIDFISCFGSTNAICLNRPFGTYDNVARTVAEGIEATLTYKPLDTLSIAATYTQLDARNDAVGTVNFNRRLSRRADENSSLSINWQPGEGLDLSATWSRTGDGFDNASNSVVLPGYDLITLRVSQKLTDQVSLYGRVENLSDEVYQTSRGYGSPPRQATVGLRATF